MPDALPEPPTTKPKEEDSLIREAAIGKGMPPILNMTVIQHTSPLMLSTAIRQQMSLYHECCQWA